MASIRFTRTCICGAVSAELDMFDAEMIDYLLPCSDACKSIADSRNAWFEIYN